MPGGREQNAREFLRSAFDTDDGCPWELIEEPSNSVLLRRSCDAAPLIRRSTASGWREWFATDLSTGLKLPVFFVNFSLLIAPDRASVVQLTAPAGCIVGTHPRSTRMVTDGTKDTFEIAVGFPRTDFSLQGVVYVIDDPSVLGLAFMRPALQSLPIQELLRTLLTGPGQAVLFILGATGPLWAVRWWRRHAPSRSISSGPPVQDPAGAASRYFQLFKPPRLLRRVILLSVGGALIVLGVLYWPFVAVGVAVILLEFGPAFVPALSLVATVELFLLRRRFARAWRRSTP